MHLKALKLAAFLCVFAAFAAADDHMTSSAALPAAPQASATPTPAISPAPGGTNGTTVPASSGQAASASAAAPKFDCTAEADPFASFCEDANQFLADAAQRRDSTTGRIVRTPLFGSLRTLVNPYSSSPDRFISLVAGDAALKNTLNAISTKPDDNSPISLATLASANQNRPDKQTSAPANAPGSSDLVEKAGVPAILAFALDSGALVKSVSGNNATLSGNFEGLVRLLTGQQVLCFDCRGALGTPVLRDIGVSASFVVNQQKINTTPTSGPANSSTPTSITSVDVPSTVGKFSSITARYQKWNPYDPRSPQFLKAWQAAVAASKQEIDSTAKEFHQALIALLVKNPIENDTQYQAVQESYISRFYDDADAGDLAKLRQDFNAFYNLTVGTISADDPQFDTKIATASMALAKYKNLWSKLLDQAKGQPLLTVEYVYSTPQNQPDTHDVRLIYGYTPAKGIGLLSINAGISLYATVPSGAQYGRLRDGQISAEYDRPFTANGIPATFSLAGYWQYQPDPGVLNITAGNLAPGTNVPLPGDAQVLLGTAGSLWVTQAKIAINAKSGIKVPIAVKWSNKTDLLSGNKLGAQVGISYDFSSLSSLFGGSQ